MIARDVLAVDRVSCPMQRVLPNLGILLTSFRPACMGSIDHFRSQLLVCFAAAGLIEDVIRLMGEIAAEQTVIATTQIVRKCTVITFVAPLKCDPLHTSPEAPALIAERAFPLDVEATVDHVLHIYHPVAVVHILRANDEGV